MIDEKLKQILSQIAERDIPDTLDLWQPIQTQLEEQPMRTRPTFRLMRVAIAIAILLLFSLISYALYQNSIHDPGLSGAEAADLFTYLDMSQTVDDVTVTLNWAYADANRIALSYETRYDRNIVGDSIGVIDTLLIDKTSDIPLINRFGGGGGGGGETSIARFESTANFQAPEGFELSGTLDLQLHLILGDPAQAGLAFGGGGGQSGGGGGGFVPEGQQPPSGVEANPMEPIAFTFDFSLPVLPALEINIDETQTVNEVTVMLQSVEVTPSLTRAVICYTPPTPDDRWLLITRLETDTMTLTWESGMPTTTVDDMLCETAEYLAPYDGTAAEWTLTVDVLQVELLYSPETAARFIELMEESGFTNVVVNPSPPDENGRQTMGYGFGSASELTPDETQIRLNHVINQLTQTVEGPWVFSFEIP